MVGSFSRACVSAVSAAPARLPYDSTRASARTVSVDLTISATISTELEEFRVENPDVTKLVEKLRGVVCPLVSFDAATAEYHGCATVIGITNKGVWAITAAHVLDDLVRRFYPRRANAISSNKYLDEDRQFPLKPFIDSGKIVLDWSNGRDSHFLALSIVAYRGTQDLGMVFAKFPEPIKNFVVPPLPISSDILAPGKLVSMYGYLEPKYSIFNSKLRRDGDLKSQLAYGPIACSNMGNNMLRIPMYEIDAESEQGMSGGPIICDQDGAGVVLTGIISYGTSGRPKPTLAIQIWNFYALRLKDSAGKVIDFRVLIQNGLVNDLGKLKESISVIVEPGGIRLGRRTKILKPDRPRILVPRNFDRR